MGAHNKQTVFCLFWMNNRIRGKFSDFEQFENALKNFSDETFQVFVTDDCKLISTVNKMRTKKLPDKLKYAFIVMLAFNFGLILRLGVMVRDFRVSVWG